MADLIDRQTAIDAMATWDWQELYLPIHFKQLLEELPSAQPEPQWIPCSETENLPEHEVLCCDRYGEELIGWLSCKDDQWLCESEGEMMYDPIAWRELPEPWRGEEP